MNRIVIVASSMLLASSAAFAANCADELVSERTYTIVNEDSGLLLDVSGYSSDNGAQVIQWSSTGGANQQWQATKLSSGSWSLRPVHSKKSLDVSGWSTADGGLLHQWAYGGSANQAWTLTRTKNGSFTIASVYSSKLVSVSDRNKGSTITQRSDAASAQQRWYFNPVGASCVNSTVSSTFMSSDKLRIGVYDSGPAASRAPFDVRYQYLSSGAPTLEACMTSCEASEACGRWWGCWQWNKEPPGQIVGVRIKAAADNTWQKASVPQLYMFTYYGFLNTSGGVEGTAEVSAMDNAATVKRHMDDYRMMLQKIGKSRAMVHLEPDLWGFVRSVNSNPGAISAQVKSGNSQDCANYDNSAAGFSRCMIDMVRKYAPNATVGLHASPWNHRREGDAQEVAKFLLALGADRSDFVVADPADRDAGYKEVVKGENWHWWTSADGDTFLNWTKQLSGFVGKPIVLWQIPLGNMSLNNTYQHYKDNKLDYFFSNLDRVAASNVVSLMFGAGHQDNTNPETDGGNLYRKTTANWEAGGTLLRK